MTPTSSLTMYTFTDLIAEISKLRERANVNSESWAKLQEVAESFALESTDGSFDLMLEKPWSLVQVSIHGHMGVLNEAPLVIDFDPRPGVTVLHGANGAGKSSISDAIETVLFKEPLRPPAPATGTSRLWDSVPIGRDFDETTIKLTLLSGTQKKLFLSCTLEASSYSMSFKSEMEESNGQRIPVVLDDTWGDALRNHRPIFAYASLERRVQTSKDLATYFEDLLALGGCFIALESAINAQSAEADAASQKWKRSKQATLAKLREIDARRRSNNGVDLVEVGDPNLSDDIDTWLTTNVLAESGELANEIPSAASSLLKIAAQRVIESVEQLSSLNDSVREKLAAPLKSLFQQAAALEISDDNCPVCLTAGSGWFSSLSSTVADFARFDAQTKAMTDALKEFGTEIQNSLTPILSISLPNEATAALIAARTQCVALVEQFESDVSSRGNEPHHAVLTSARILSNWILSNEAEELIAHAVMQTNLLRQWRVERSKAVNAFVNDWREIQVLGRMAITWQGAKKRVVELRDSLRNQRSATLKTRVSDRVNFLLNDVGMNISGLNVQSTKASLALTDSEGNSLELGMLSAGQRNAILLAPLLAALGDGPFSFLVLDDPVHAFDELRIDRLAQVITELAIDKRVIVLTHDERLRQHLLASSEECDTRLVSRAVAVGAVLVESSSHLWMRLLEDAKLIYEMGRPIEGTLMSVADTVRGLCRQSVDNALTDFVTQNAISNGREYAKDIQRLDEALTTKKRFEIAQGFHVGLEQNTNPAMRAQIECDPFLHAWNMASHGNLAESEVGMNEIEAAYRACAFLSESISST